jgi:hypothetical protein
MNGGVKSVFGVSLAGLFIVLAVNGAAFVQAAQAAWLFLLSLSTTAPLGVSSFFMASALAIVSQPFLRKWLPHLRCPMSREFIIESAALGIGVGVMWAQLHTLNGLLLGLLAGFSAPYIQKGIAACIALAGRAFMGKPTQ